MPTQQPNILLIWTDQQRSDTLPALGNTHIEAPALKKLGEESVIFRRAYCTQPVCTPSRASVMTGLWPHTNGCVTNNIPLRPDARTIAEMLPSDYHCAYYGKWHLGNELRAQHGFTDWRSIEDGIYRAYYDHPDDLQRRSDYHHFLFGNGFPPDDKHSDGAEIYSRVFAAAMAEPYTKASFVAGEADRFLREQKGDRPFFLSVNFLEPHPPNFGPLNNLYEPDEVPVGPAFFRPPPDDAPPSIRRRCAEYREHGDRNYPLKTESNWRRYRANYLGLVTLIDRAVGRILAALEASGQADNTLVVFTSDHGEMSGDHCLRGKGVFYEESSRIPLMFRAPWLSRKQAILEQPVSLIDLVPTMLEFAGCAIPEDLQGRSRTGVIADAAAGKPAAAPADDTEPVIVEWNDPKRPDEEGRSAIGADGWKLSLYNDGSAELYDLNADPAELTNLARDPAHGDRLKKLTDSIQSWQEKTGDTVSLIK